MSIFGALFQSKRGAPGVTFKEKKVTNGNTYEVYKANSKQAALDFLRRTPVRKERHYLICETSEGGIGKDIVMLFDEQTQTRIEYGERAALPSFKKSGTHCARCGYPVLPAGHSSFGTIYLVPLPQMKEKGVGIRCARCPTLWCPFCLRPDAIDTCGICGNKMALYEE